MADTIWPGFVLDASLDSARIGNPSIADRALPNVIFEDVGRFFMIEFGERDVNATSQSDLRLYEVEGVTFDKHGETSGRPYVDLSQAVVDEDSVVLFSDLNDGFSTAMTTILSGKETAARPAN
jgi:hypothetical protein